MDHAAEIAKFVKSPDADAVDGLLANYRLVLSQPDSATVAFSDRSELDRVRVNFVQKKLGVADTDAEIDAAIKQVGETLKPARSKSRAVVYYLLAEHYGKLDQFKKPAAK